MARMNSSACHLKSGMESNTRQQEHKSASNLEMIFTANLAAIKMMFDLKIRNRDLRSAHDIGGRVERFFNEIFSLHGDDLEEKCQKQATAAYPRSICYGADDEDRQPADSVDGLPVTLTESVDEGNSGFEPPGMGITGDTTFGRARVAPHRRFQDLGETETDGRYNAVELKCVAEERGMGSDDWQLQTNFPAMEKSSVSSSDAVTESRHPQIDPMMTVFTPVGRAAVEAACSRHPISEGYLKQAITQFVEETTLDCCDSTCNTCSRANLTHCTFYQKRLVRDRLLKGRGPRQRTYSAIQGCGTSSEGAGTTTGEVSSEKCERVAVSPTAKTSSSPFAVGAETWSATPSSALPTTAADDDVLASSSGRHAVFKPTLERLVGGKRKAEEADIGRTLCKANRPGGQVEMGIDPTREGAKCRLQGGHHTMPNNSQSEQHLCCTETRELRTPSSTSLSSETGQDEGNGGEIETDCSCITCFMPNMIKRRSAGAMNRVNSLGSIGPNATDGAGGAAVSVENSATDHLFTFASIAQEFVNDNHERAHRLRPLVEGR